MSSKTKMAAAWKKLAVMLFLAALVFITAAAVAVRSVTAQTADADSELQEFYTLGDAIEIPDGVLHYGGKDIPATQHVVYYPGGKAVAADSVLLDEPGEYSVVYSAEADGTALRGEGGFIVRDELYSVGNEKSSAVYGTHPQYAKDKEGIVLSLARGDVFEYNRIIDFTDKKKTDKILEIVVTPLFVGTADATEIVVRFTDVWDETNYVDVCLRNLSSIGSWADPTTYAVAGATGQTLSGLEDGNVHQGNEYGTPFNFSLVGKPRTGAAVGSETFGISFDYEKKQVFGTNPVYATADADKIIDLDETNYFVDPWGGFTTGEAKLSIFARNNQTSSLNLVLTNINGEDLQENSRIDRDAPRMSVDFGEYTEDNLPDGIAGKAYRVFESSAYDADEGAVRVYKNVYRNYGREDQTICRIRDGSFVPQIAGEYSIVYYAADSFGNDVTQVVKVQVGEADKFLNIALNGQAQSGVAGQTVKVLGGVEEENASGNVALQIEAALKDGDIRYEVDPNSFTFCPEYAGTYEITVTAEDYVSTATESFEITIAPGTKPNIFEEAQLPKYFIKNCEYTLPEIAGYEFSTGAPVETEVSISASEDGGEEKAIAGSRYKVTANNTVTIIYTAKAGEETFAKRYEIPVIDVGYGGAFNPAGYFNTLSGSFEKSLTEASLNCLTTEDSSMEFINPLLTQPFSFLFSVDAEKNAMDAISVYLIDSLNPSEQIKVRFRKTAGGSMFSVNDGFEYLTEAEFGESQYNFTVNYDNTSHKLTTVGGMNMTVETYLDGRPFNGFSSQKVYLKVEVTGVTGEACVQILNINRQGFFEMDSDIGAPQISITASQGDRNMNDEVLLAATYALDVFDPDITFTMQMIAPDGSFVTAQDGTVIDGTNDPSKDYTVKLTQYGEYLIQYVATDSNGTVARYSYGISVTDTEKPELVLSGQVTEGKVGKSVKLATYTATDNMSAEVIVRAYAEAPSGKIFAVSESFTPEERGVYTIRFSAYDEVGNFSMVSYTITVK